MLGLVAEGVILVVPDLWFYEVGNVLTICQRRGRITVEQKDEAVRLLSKLPVEIKAISNPANLNAIIVLAQRHDLSFYDASYLALATQEALSLATLDRKLIRSAATEGVRLFSDDGDEAASLAAMAAKSLGLPEGG